MPSHYCPLCNRTFKIDQEKCPRDTCHHTRPAEGWSEVLERGDLLDRHYRVEKVLAVAGAGLTYQAREIDADGSAFGPVLAIKELYAHHTGDRQLQRLATEAQILQAVNHPNLVELRGFVQRAGKLPYLVTLFEEGGNLAQHLKREGAVPPRTAAGILVQILSALDVTHERGIVHRDLKADNILLAKRCSAEEVPQIRVADFGVAKVRGAPNKATVQGVFIGTPEYAAPEQFAGRAPTAATDVFAAGCLFVECLTGRTPVRFEDRNDLDAVVLQWAVALPFQQQLPGPPELSKIVNLMLQREPTARPEIRVLLECLQPMVDGGAPVLPSRALAVDSVPEASRVAGVTGVGIFGGLAMLGTAILCLAIIVAAAWGFGHLSNPGVVHIR